MNREYREHGFPVGPGGRDCPCCSPFGEHPRNTKQLERQMVRTRAKRAVKREIERELNDDVM